MFLCFRWNFSVGQHDLNFMSDRNVGCKNEVEQQNTDNFEIKAIIPEGIICAVNKLNPNEIIWKYKVKSHKSGEKNNIQSQHIIFN